MHKPLSILSLIVFLVQVFTLRSVLKVLSIEQVVTGRVNAIVKAI